MQKCEKKKCYLLIYYIVVWLTSVINKLKSEEIRMLMYNCDKTVGKKEKKETDLQNARNYFWLEFCNL